MGEGAEQTPLAIIEEIDFIKFDKKRPTKEDFKNFYVSPEEDSFHQFYKNLK